MSVGDILDREEDRPAYVRFETRAVQDKAATLEAGHHVSKDVHWALVTPPYSKDCVEMPAEKWFARTELEVKSGRIPEKHFRYWKEVYKHYLEGLEEPVNGTSVKDWNALSPAQCKNLISAGCRTIEDLAQANDEAIRRIGMGAIDLRNKAKAWLQAAKDHGPLISQVAQLQKENDQLKGSLESLQNKVKLLEMMAESDSHDDEDMDELAGMFEAKFGKKPHHKMKAETIRQKLME